MEAVSAANWAESEAAEVVAAAAPFNPRVYVSRLLASPVFQRYTLYMFPSVRPPPSVNSVLYFCFRYLLFCSPSIELPQRYVCVAGYVAGHKRDKRAFRHE